MELESGTGDSTGALQGDIAILRQELLNMEAKRDALLRQIEQEEQSITDDKDSPLPSPVDTVADDQEQKRLQDILMAYRLTGVTLFNGDEFDHQDWSQYDVDDILEGPKDAGIRFDTFALGRYYEPYYIMLRTTPIGTRNNPQNLDDDEDPQLDIKKTFEIVKHTIPHWIPLRELEKRYLNRDMSTFTRSVSDYLQAFVTRRENINEIISTFSLDKSLIQAATAASEAAAVAAAAAAVEEGATTPAPEQDAISIPEITCKTKDAAIRDIVLSCFQYDTLFTLYHRRQARVSKKKDAGNQQKPTTATSTSMFSSNFGDNTKLLDDDDLAMDLDKESEEELELKADLELLKSHPGAAVLSVQIHLIYEGSHSTTPTRADVRFSRGLDLIQIDSLPRKHPLREQHAKWINSLTTNYSLYHAILSIADLHKPQ
ncbi:hypothetical protein K457DRAFT_21960 [Linnemannia elongata AG-77]|uniref:Uncharacterized protein n=1 Tax=Linnemannia elongata AG-77 TaxID=1314771 RepID=A0A197JQG9_9FUNG|nr:hypothetical protein K457DRAFT_21960 [Linnemannia elongata AG-77]